MPNTRTCGAKWLATIAPTAAPSNVPTKRCQETVSAAPNDDCVITTVVIGAQYACGSRNNPAASNEATATAAVRTECTKTGHPVHLTPALAIASHPRDNPKSQPHGSRLNSEIVE